MFETITIVWLVMLTAWVWRVSNKPNPVIIEPYPLGTEIVSGGGYIGVIVERLTKELGPGYCYRVAFPALDLTTAYVHDEIQLATQ